jgi:hypothetical protein
MSGIAGQLQPAATAAGMIEAAVVSRAYRALEAELAAARAALAGVARAA